MIELIPPEQLMPAVDLPVLDLPTEDGIPLESNWHRMEMNLLIESIHTHWHDRQDYFAGGNMFIYFSLEQVRNRDYRGPDFFVVKGVDGLRDRAAWIVWEEEGRYPDVIVELSSPSTVEVDLGSKKRLYEGTFRTPEYYCYDPTRGELQGWRLISGHYVDIQRDEPGWLWSEELGLWLGRWEGEFQRSLGTWLRFYTEEGHLVPTLAEAAIRRAEAAEAELTRLRAQLARGSRDDGDQAIGGTGVPQP